MDVFDLVAKLTLDSSEYDSSLDKAESRGSSFGESLKSGLGTAAKAGVAAVGAATTAVTAFATKSVKTGADFDSSMSQVAATMGLTMDQMSQQIGTVDTAFGSFEGNLREYAQFMGANTAFSASQAADALNYMALAGYDTQTSMEMLPNVLNLAAAGGIDLASASDMVTDAQSALGLSLEETSTMVDQMAAASSKSNTSVAQLGEAFLTVGATARNLDGGTTELAAVLGVLADNGIKGAEGGTHLRNALLSLQTPSEAGAAALEQLGMSYEDMYDEFGNMRALPDIFLEMQQGMEGMTQASKDAIISGIFNKTDLAAVNALLGTSASRWHELEGAISGAWFTTEGLTAGFDAIGYITTFDDFAASLESIGVNATELENALNQCGGDAEYFTDILTGAVNAGVSYDDILQALPMDLDELQMAFDATAGSAQAMADTQLDNLSGDITLLQSAFEGVQIAVSDMLTPTLREFVQFGTDGFSQLTTALADGDFSAAMDAFGQILADGLAMIMDMLPTMVDAGMQLLSSLIQGIIDNIPTLVTTATDIVVQLAGFIITALPELLSAAVEIITTLATNIAGAIPELVPTIVDVVVSIVNTLIENVSLLVDAAVEIMVALANAIIDNLPTLIEQAPVLIEELVSALVENVPKLAEAALQIISSLVLYLAENFPQIITAGGYIVTSLITGITNLLTNLLSAGKDIINEVWDGIKSLDPAQWGADLISSFIDGLKSAWESLKGGISDIAQGIKDFLGFSEPKKGPLSDFHTYAPDMMQLYAEGIRDNAHLVEDQLNKSLNFDNEFGINASGTLGGAGGMNNNININVYGAEGQDETKIAESIADILRNQVLSRGAVYA